MFAYCGNNPVITADPSGKRPPWEGKHGEYTDTGSSIYESIINGQGREPYASLDFGSSSVAQSGCGAIAVHNALLLLGYSSDFRSWIDYFESKCYLRDAGVMPWEIDNALDVAGVSYEGSGDSFISERCKNGGVVILTYWNEVTLISEPATYYRGPVYGYFRNISRGAHTIAVTYHDNQYWVYNAWNGAIGAWGTTNIDYCTKRGTFIYGFYIYPNS